MEDLPGLVLTAVELGDAQRVAARLAVPADAGVFVADRVRETADRVGGDDLVRVRRTVREALSRYSKTVSASAAVVAVFQAPNSLAGLRAAGRELPEAGVAAPLEQDAIGRIHRENLRSRQQQETRADVATELGEVGVHQ